jgi:hypothetical protein
MLDQLDWRMGWGRTFPVILIVIGVVKILQHSASTEGHVDWRNRLNREAWVRCPNCNGASVVFDQMGRTSRCPACNGRGVVPAAPAAAPPQPGPVVTPPPASNATDAPQLPARSDEPTQTEDTEVRRG